MSPGGARVGISGWTYGPWRGAFYPDGLRRKQELAYAASIFSSIEINGTFYGLQTPAAFGAWADAVPEDFEFAVKASRFITHLKRLRDVETPLANFLASGVLRLGRKLGPILWQLPPNFKFDAALLDDFFALLPRTTKEAAALAGRHDARLKAPAWLDVAHRGRIRHALEVRHESFRNAQFVSLLRRHGVALVCADAVKWPQFMDLTTDFVYCRLHGSVELYRSKYEKAALRAWAGRVRAWTQGRKMRSGNFIADVVDDRKARDAYVYFDNTDKLHAPRDAQALMALLNNPAHGTRH